MSLRDRINKSQVPEEPKQPVRRVPRWIERMQAKGLPPKDLTREPVL